MVDGQEIGDDETDGGVEEDEEGDGEEGDAEEVGRRLEGGRGGGEGEEGWESHGQCCLTVRYS